MKGEDADRTLRWFTLATSLLPIVAAFLLAVSQAFSPRTKWAQLKSASTHVESSIWKFRARVGPYRVNKRKKDATDLHQSDHGKAVQAAERRRLGADPLAGETSTPEEIKLDVGASPNQQKGESSNAEHLEARRNVFAKEIESIQTTVRTGELRGSHLTSLFLREGDDRIKRSGEDCEEEPPEESNASRRRQRKIQPELEVEGTEQSQALATDTSAFDTEQLGGPGRRLTTSLERPMMYPCCCLKRRIPIPPVQAAGELSAEYYIENRLKKMCNRYERLAPILSWRRDVLRVLLIFATSVNTVLAVLPNYKQWIPAVVATAASIDTIMKDQRLVQRLSAINAAILELHNLLNWWESLTLVESRLDDNLEHLVLSCEKVANAGMVWETVVAKSGVERKKAATKSPGTDAKGTEVGSSIASRDKPKKM